MANLFTEKDVAGRRASALLYTANPDYRNGHNEPRYWNADVQNSVNAESLKARMFSPERIEQYFRKGIPDFLMEGVAEWMQCTQEELKDALSDHEIIETAASLPCFAECARSYAEWLVKGKKGLRELSDCMPLEATDRYALQLEEDDSAARVVNIKVTKSEKDPFMWMCGSGKTMKVGLGRGVMGREMQVFISHAVPVARYNLESMSGELPYNDFSRDLHHTADVLEVEDIPAIKL